MPHENVYFANGSYDRRSSKLADNENAKCRVVFEKATVISVRLSPAWSKIARTSVKVGETRLLPLVQLTATTFQLITRRVKDDTELVRFTQVC